MLVAVSWPAWVWLEIGAAGVVAVVAAGWALHRLCIALEDRGYIYYRKSSGSGGSGMASVFLELDRFTRPSVEHVIEAQSSQTKVADDDEGDGKEPGRRDDRPAE